jgi:signal recognition particle GTPase
MEAVAAMDPEESSKLLTSRMPTRKRKVLLAAADVYRPAAIQQLEILGKSIGVEVFSMGTDADPVDIAAAAVAKAIAEGYDTVLVDTAGRQVIDTNLMDELCCIKETGKQMMAGATFLVFITRYANFIFFVCVVQETRMRLCW